MHIFPLFLLLFVLYAAAVSVGAWLTLGAERRQQIQRQLKATASDSGATCAAWLTLPWRAASHLFSFGTRVHTVAATNIRSYKKPLLIAAVLLLVPVIFALLFASHSELEGYDELPAPADPVIASLLRGEQLVPPAALPPALFTTKEITAERQGLADANREWALLNPDFRQRLLAVYQLMAMHGYQMVLIEGYRSPQRQADLAMLGPQVTNVGAYQSYHQYGLAADSAFYRDGRIVVSEKDPWAMKGYRLYGNYAESVGLVWGGSWRMRDLGHVELRKPGVLAKN